MSYKFIDGSGLVALMIIPTIEQLTEDPLCPFVVIRVRGAYLSAPIKGEAHLVELGAIAADILLGGLAGVLPRLNGVLLGRQAKGIISLGVQHIEPLVTFVSRDYIAGDIA